MENKVGPLCWVLQVACCPSSFARDDKLLGFGKICYQEIENGLSWWLNFCSTCIKRMIIDEVYNISIQLMTILDQLDDYKFTTLTSHNKFYIDSFIYLFLWLFILKW